MESGQCGWQTTHVFCLAYIALISKGLVTNYGEGGGGLQNGRWGAREVFTPPKKGGQKKFEPC